MNEITGYRKLSQAETDLINEIKAVATKLKQLHDKAAYLIQGDVTINPSERMRWLSIGRTHYQQATMALTRAIAAPTNE